MTSRVTLKAINDELARLGYASRLAKGGGYFYFQFGEAGDWLDCTVAVPKISSHSLEEWIAEFRRLKKLNDQLMTKPLRSPKSTPKGRPSGGAPAASAT
jgi:hypothetical protein